MPIVPKERCSPPSSAVSEVIMSLHQAKQELAAEMEANLKQLKAILQETQTISKEMEAVLKELKGERSSQGSPKGTSKNQQSAAWCPPAEASLGSEQQQHYQNDQNSQGQNDEWIPPSCQAGGSQQGTGWQPPPEAYDGENLL